MYATERAAPAGRGITHNTKQGTCVEQGTAQAPPMQNHPRACKRTWQTKVIMTFCHKPSNRQ